LQFSRREEPINEPVDLGPILQTTLDLIKYDFSTSGIDIIQDLQLPLPSIYGDPNQLQQVFLNLITNARQAMETQKKGQLTIRGEVKGDFVRLYFKDNGPGIPPESLSKIFDPFYTTKPPGKGTGLGLSICYGIMKQHQGNLYVESTLGAGATFVMELPVYE
jgi:two-component system NtrC family sensor kinase